MVEKMPNSSTGMAMPLTATLAVAAVRPHKRMLRSKTTASRGSVTVRKKGSGGRKVMVKVRLRRLPSASMAITSRALTPGATGTVS